ncbi:MAG TPA: hypothetical protein VIH83_04790 [Candidatus Bathyarchaeia archaeon]
MQPSSPFRRSDPDEPDYGMEVFVEEMGESSGVGGGVANFLSGYAIYKGEKFRFEAVAYGRIGGQNVSPTLTDEAMNRLQELDVNLEGFVARLQRKLVEGEITLNLPEGSAPPESLP